MQRFHSGRMGSGDNGAFTLMEMLVATAVFALLSISLLQILSHVSLMTRNSYTRIKSDAEARGVFDRMLLDTDSMIRDASASLIISGNQVVLGLSSTGTDFNKRGKVATYVTVASGLQRRIRDLEWSETALGPFQNGTEDFQILGDNVIGMIVRIVLSDETISDTVSMPSLRTKTDPYPLEMVVGIALADRQALRNLRISDPASLVPAVPANKLPLDIWSDITTATPSQAQVRYYQRTYKIR